MTFKKKKSKIERDVFVYIWNEDISFTKGGKMWELFWVFYIVWKLLYKWDNLVYVLYVTCAVNWRDDMRSGSHVRRGNIRGKCVKVWRHDASCKLYSYLSSDK